MISFAVLMLSKALIPIIAVLPAAASLPSATGQAVIPSTIRTVVEFQDRGRAYTIDTVSGRVSFVDTAPQPQPEPQPDPKPPVIQEQAAWVSLLVAPYDAAQRAWMTDPKIRDAATRAGVQFRAFSSTEEDVDTLGFRPLARENTIPCVIVQDKDGKVLLSRKVTGIDDIIAVIGGGK